METDQYTATHSRGRSLNKKLWDDFRQNGYNLHISDTYEVFKATKFLFQKRIKDKEGQTLFFIDIWIYFWDTIPYIKDDKPTIAFQPEVQYNINTDQYLTFEVTLKVRDWSVQQIEEFFLNIYNKLNCDPYGDD